MLTKVNAYTFLKKIEEIENLHIKLTFQFKTWLSTRSRWPLTWRNMTKHKLFIAKIVGVLVGLIILFGLTTSPTDAQGPGGSTCSQAQPPNFCTLVEEGDIQAGIYTALTTITKFVVSAGGNEATFFPANGQFFDNGCVSGTFSTSEGVHENDTVTWQRNTEDENCQEISHVEIWWYVAPTGVTLKSLSANGDRSTLYMVGVPILLFLVAITLAFFTWRHRRNKNNQIGG